jgi:hypothetical protein
MLSSINDFRHYFKLPYPVAFSPRICMRSSIKTKRRSIWLKRRPSMVSSLEEQY